MKMLRSLIQDGYTALLEQRCQSAAQAFTELLNGLDPQKIKVKLSNHSLFINTSAPQMNLEEIKALTRIYIPYTWAGSR